MEALRVWPTIDQDVIHECTQRKERGRQAHCSHGYDRSVVSNLAFYKDLEPHLFKQFRMVSLGRVLWNLACY